MNVYSFFFFIITSVKSRNIQKMKMKKGKKKEKNCIYIEREREMDDFKLCVNKHDRCNVSVFWSIDKMKQFADRRIFFFFPLFFSPWKQSNEKYEKLSKPKVDSIFSVEESWFVLQSCVLLIQKFSYPPCSNIESQKFTSFFLLHFFLADRSQSLFSIKKYD